MCVCTVVKFRYQKIHIKHSTLSKILCHKFLCEHCVICMCKSLCVCVHICVGRQALAYARVPRPEVSAWCLTLVVFPLSFGDLVFHCT